MEIMLTVFTKDWLAVIWHFLFFFSVLLFALGKYICFSQWAELYKCLWARKKKGKKHVGLCALKLKHTSGIHNSFRSTSFTLECIANIFAERKYCFLHTFC